MKTSTKIFIGVAAVATVLCAVNFVIARVQYKKCEPMARALAEQLDRTPIRVVCLNDDAPVSAEHNNPVPVTRGEGKTWLRIDKSGLQSARISGDTIFLSGTASASPRVFFNSPDIETVIIRRGGQPDQVQDYRPAEPEPQDEESQAQEIPAE